MSGMAERYPYPKPIDAESIEAIAARRYEQELEIRDILATFFEGNLQHVSDWFFMPIKEKPFSGRIPAAALITDADAVHKFVKDTYQ